MTQEIRKIQAEIRALQDTSEGIAKMIQGIDSDRKAVEEKTGNAKALLKE